MCQINVYLVNKNVDISRLGELEKIDVARNYLMYSNYNFYHDKDHCNCGSFVSYFQNDMGELNLDEYCNKKITILNEIAELISQKSYKKEVKDFKKRLKKLEKNWKAEGGYKAAKKEYFKQNYRDNLINISLNEFDNLGKINAEILKYKNKSFEYDLNEFDNIKKTLEKLLELTPRVGFFAFWQGDVNDLNLIKSRVIKFSDLKIDDLLALKYEHVITITK